MMRKVRPATSSRYVSGNANANAGGIR